MAVPNWLPLALTALSFLAPLAATFLLTREKRSFIFLAALAICCFVLFNWLALPGFFIGLGAASLEREWRKEKRNREIEAGARERREARHKKKR
ncbi:MAG: hypothetical protein V1817_03325 [Candidatus Micrarchaeota archaeon]